MHICAYLANTSDVSILEKWAVGKDFYGRWMPETPDVIGALLAAHPDDPTWEHADGEIDWRGVGREQPPCTLALVGARYGGTGTSRDGSASEETRGFVPSRRLHEVLRLKRSGDFEWTTTDGRLAAQDPSVHLGGPSCLVVRKDVAVERLADAGLTLFWTVVVGKELHTQDFVTRDDYQWVSASSSYVLHGSSVRQLDASAHVYQPGPTALRQLDWPTRQE
jgi:hypothetical protein